jgi:hypothetical protein
VKITLTVDNHLQSNSPPVPMSPTSLVATIVRLSRSINHQVPARDSRLRPRLPTSRHP